MRMANRVIHTSIELDLKCLAKAALGLLLSYILCHLHDIVTIFYRQLYERLS